MNPNDPNQPQPESNTPADTPAPAAQPAAAPNQFGSAAPVSSEVPVTTPLGQPTPLGSTPNGAPSQKPAKSNKKLIILISAIVGGLIVLGGAALAVYFIFFSVSKADYKQAYDQLNTLQSTVSKTTLSGDSSELDEKFAKFKDANAKLGDLKALRADKDLNVKYKAYKEKATAYITFMDSFIPSYQKLSDATKTLSGSSSSLLKSSSVEATISALEDADSATDPSIKAYVDSLLSTYKDILPQVKIYETSTVSSERLKALTAISKSAREMTSAATKFSDDIKDRAEAVSPKETFDALSDAVTKKYNQK